MSQSIAGEPWDPDRIGMNVLRAWQPWDLGGPFVQHSEWWLRERWGRAFDVEILTDTREPAHGLIVLRKRDVSLTRQELIASSDDPREMIALAHNVDQVAREVAALVKERDAVAALVKERDAVACARVAALVKERDAVACARDAAAETLRVMTTSHSWRFTKPLRAAARLVR